MKVNNQPRAPLVNNQETNVIIFYPPEENSEPTMTSAEAEADKKSLIPKKMVSKFKGLEEWEEVGFCCKPRRGKRKQK